MRFLLALLPMAALAAGLDSFSLYAIRSVRLGDTVVPQGSDIRGRMACAGDVWLSNLSVGVPGGEKDPRMVLARGKAILKDVVVENGGLEAGGDVELEGSSVAGTLWTGGSFRGRRSSVKGTVRYAGSHRAEDFGSAGRRQREFRLSFDYDAFTKELRSRSETYGKLAGAPLREAGKGRFVCAEQSANPVVCEIPAKIFERVKELVFQGKEGRLFVVNVTGKEAKLSFKATFADETGKPLDPRAPDGAVLWNFRKAAKVSLRGVDMPGTLLAPEATVTGDEFSRLRGRAHVGAFEGQARVGL